MTTNDRTAGALQEVRLPVQVRLAAAWASFMFFYIYVDYLALYKPGFLDEVLAGRVHEFDTGPVFVGAAITLVGIPSLMIVLSATLPARANRLTNLVVATLYVPVSVYNASGESWDYAWFYGLSIGVEVLLLAYVLRAAWAWPRTVGAAVAGDVERARA
jgi:hypothetical protein